MRRKPLDNPKLYGCATCTRKQTTLLTDNKTLYPGDVHIMSITIDGYFENLEAENGIKISEINKMFENKLTTCQFAELHHETPLHDETYEYNTNDGNWYLVAQGQGYA